MGFYFALKEKMRPDQNSKPEGKEPDQSHKPHKRRSESEKAVTQSVREVRLRA